MKLVAKMLTALVFSVITLGYSGCKSEQAVTLKFKPEKDKKYEFVMTTNQDIEADQGGQKMQMKNNMEFTYHMLVKERDDKNNTVIVSTFKKIKLSVSGTGGADISYDSEKPQPEGDFISSLYNKAFGGLLGKSITMVVDEKGSVISLTGMQKIFDDMITNMDLDTLPQGAMAIEGIRKSFSDETFKKSFDDMFKILPDREINVGDTWDVTTNKDMMGMAFDTKTKYQLKDLDSKVATVTLSGTVEVGKGATPMPGMEMSMSGTQAGTMKIDRKTGLATESQINQDLTMVQKSMGMEIPMKLKSIIKVTSKEI